MSMDKIQQNLAEYEKIAVGEVVNNNKDCGVDALYWVGYCKMYSYQRDLWPAGFELWKQAASLGSGKALCQLGFCYRHGEGTPKNVQKSTECYQQAVAPLQREAANLDSESQAMLGFMYEFGLGGLTQNYPEAVRLYTLSSEQENTVGQNLLAGCYRAGTPGVEGGKVDHAKAAKLFAKSAHQGSAVAMLNFGWACEQGEGVPRDLQKAFQWYQKSANLNYPGGMNCLGRCYRNGIGVKQNYELALQWFHKAATEHNYVDALRSIGYAHQQGFGVPVNYELAVKWYLKAKQAHEEDASAHVGEEKEDEITRYLLESLLQDLIQNKIAVHRSVAAMRTMAYCAQHGVVLQQHKQQQSDALAQAWLEEAEYQETKQLMETLGSTIDSNSLEQDPELQQEKQQKKLQHNYDHDNSDNQEPNCICCEERRPTTILVHGDTGHACCCFLCAQICLSITATATATTTTTSQTTNSDLGKTFSSCPICRLPIEQVALYRPPPPPRQLQPPNKNNSAIFAACGCTRHGTSTTTTAKENGDNSVVAVVLLHGETCHSTGLCYNCAKARQQQGLPCPECGDKVTIDQVLVQFHL